MRIGNAPILFLENSSATINSVYYRWKIAPKRAVEASRGSEILLVQNNVPPHSSSMTINKLRARGISSTGSRSVLML